MWNEQNHRGLCKIIKGYGCYTFHMCISIALSRSITVNWCALCPFFQFTYNHKQVHVYMQVKKEVYVIFAHFQFTYNYKEGYVNI